ncbi:MAG: AmmeMemoRadiSam system radical SAM enzyme [Oscillospiraceae bacterium]|nr:AmmeMemoRadiSam system radical SAM enzyme [Oscillospiraceae bacterium]
MKTICALCPHHCALEPGQAGLCHARKNEDGKIISTNYGRLTALALDPIEKKPLCRFHPGSWILSVGSYGCNLKCPFCQNYEISMKGMEADTLEVSPEELVRQALEAAKKPRGNLGLAFTYNEPLVGYEYVFRCAQLAKEAGLLTVVVTNGMICEEPLCALLPFVDAMNIDLKCFTESGYEKLGGSLETVRHTIELAVSACHVEVTTLAVPGFSDSVEEMDAEAQWLASIDRAIPLHITRCFPRYRMQDGQPTPVSTVKQLCETAGQYLQYVYAGNC